MKEYELKIIENCEYNRFLLCLTFESLFYYLKRIETEPTIYNSSGTLLIDQLLITGNGINRYLRCSFYNGKIDVSTAINVTPDEECRQISLAILKENIAILNNSILTEKQKANIINGILF